jgi:hypothetical protein
MQCLPFFVAVALVLGSIQLCGSGELIPADCNSIGCVRPTNALEELSKIAERRFSKVVANEMRNFRDLCSAGTCSIEPAATSLPEGCGRAGCAGPRPKPQAAAATADQSASNPLSTLVTDTFAAVAKRPISLVPWAEWTQRGGLGGLYDPRLRIERHRS